MTKLLLLTATTSIKTKAELAKKMETTKKNQQKLTFPLSLGHPGFGWSRFISLFMVSLSLHSLFIEHHVSSGSSLIQSTIIKLGKNYCYKILEAIRQFDCK